MKEAELIEKVTEIRKLNPYGRYLQFPKIIPPKKEIRPLTEWEKWFMAVILNVPLEVVYRTEKRFFDYIKTKKKNYKSSYAPIKKWIEMGIDKGQIQECNETEKMLLATQDPDMIKLIKEAFKK